MIQACTLDTLPSSSFLWSSSKNHSSLLEDIIHQVFKQFGPDEGTVVAYALELKQHFGNCIFLCEIIYA